jgi:CheY-like chemotaxis protein
VDNDRHARMSARHVLKSRGYRVVDVASSRSALAASARHPKRFAALVTNIVLPEINGYMLAERLRAERPDLKLLFLTSYPGRSAPHAAVPLRGAAFLPKPFTAASLSSTLRRLLDDPDG